ncbi:stage II sporulation protein R [Ferviditalea candida]|uniref:Stage II sporulation protein R n=1 Tax=Ferviditalea candida TaxID=3108399 RepID=A0ABU5ZJW8_9BACL|nr:stage II sporulation protein R [Paenibacillaceae bacterium T2]
MLKKSGFRIYLYVFFLLSLLMANGEAEMANAAVVTDKIPEQAIRLRILANSDQTGDQWVKRKVRDAIVESMNGWVRDPMTIEQARTEIRTHIPDLKNIVGSVLHKYGFDYGYKVELGIVPFPTKLYGNQVYPAGNYEALRVTLGNGEGQNWWCVLFPPLCFVDVSGDAVPRDSLTKAAASSQNKDAAVRQKESAGQMKEGKSKGTEQQNLSANSGQSSDSPKPDKEVRFFIVDLFRRLIDLIKSFFS